MTPPPLTQLHTAWVSRVRTWLDTGHGRQTQLADALGINRRRVSQWFVAERMSVPAWTVAPIERLTGIVHHTDHIPPLPPV